MTAGRSVHSQSVHWCTPQRYVEAVKKVFGGTIELDPCSNQWSLTEAKTAFSLPDRDGLKEDWNYKTIYVNPPYGADRMRGTSIKLWLYKCNDANQRFDSQVLALVPVAGNTSHWKEYVWGRARALCFLYETRLKFLENGDLTGTGAPMSCAVIYWGRYYRAFFNVFLKFGAVVDLRELIGKDIGKAIRGKNQRLNSQFPYPFDKMTQMDLL